MLRYERRLALGEDDNTGNEFEACRDSREVAEEHERLVKHILVGVRAAPVWTTALRVRAEHVIEHEQVLETEALDRLRVGTDGARVGADLGLRKDNAKLHLHLLLIPVLYRREQPR